MKVKQFFLWGMMALMLCSLSACRENEDDPDNRTEEEMEDQLNEGNESEEVSATDDNVFSEAYAELSEDNQLLFDQLTAVESILRTLAGVEEVTLPLDGSYEPTYGFVLDGADPLTRNVICESPEEAEMRFRAIVGVPKLLKSTADGYSISLRNMPLTGDDTTVTLGTLTFHRGDGLREMGYVEVNIRCIPHLETINYMPSSAFPDNGSNDSPYEIGDLIRYDGSTYAKGYYVCIRKPQSGYGGLLVHLSVGEQEGTNTKNLDGDKQGCWYPINKSKGMPTRKEDVEAYLAFLGDEDLRGKIDNLKWYLNGKVVERQPVLKNRIDDIFPVGFNNDRGYIVSGSTNTRIVYDADYDEGHDKYYGIFGGTYRRVYYWWIPSPNWTMKYFYATTASYYTDSWWNDFVRGENMVTMNIITFGNSPVAGASIEYCPTNESLTFLNDGKYVTKEHLGWAYTSSNRLYETPNKARHAGQVPIGIVVYVNDGSAFGNQVTEKDGDYYGHALVLSIANVAGDPSVRWNPGSGLIADKEETYSPFTQYVDKKTGTAAALTDFGGLAKTTHLYYQGSEAAQVAMDCSYETAVPYSTGWFLPSTAQWLAMFCSPGLGGMPMPDKSGGMPVYVEHDAKKAFENINAHLVGTGVYTFGARNYWSSSTYNGYTGIYATGSGGTSLTWYNQSKKARVRPVLAF